MHACAPTHPHTHTQMHTHARAPGSALGASEIWVLYLRAPRTQTSDGICRPLPSPKPSASSASRDSWRQQAGEAAVRAIRGLRYRHQWIDSSQALVAMGTVPQPPGAERILQPFPWRGPCCSPVLCSSGCPSFPPVAPGRVALCFLPSRMVTFCGFLKPLLFCFPGSREGRALSWPVVPPVPGAQPSARGPQVCHSSNLPKEPRISPKEC